MLNELKKSSFYSPFIILIFSAITIQLLGRYHAHKYLVIDRHFYLLWVILRIIIPLGIINLLKIPISKLNIKLPKIDKDFAKIIFIMIGIVIIAFIGIYFFQEYFKSYSGNFQSLSYDKISRFQNFIIFTSSTLIGWEFLHRGFLLMGLIFILKDKEGIDENLAIKISICVVWIFEVVFHFIKPELEAFGMLLGSPILSYLAIRSKSILLPFALHLLVEILFIFSLIMR